MLRAPPLPPQPKKTTHTNIIHIKIRTALLLLRRPVARSISSTTRYSTACSSTHGACACNFVRVCEVCVYMCVWWVVGGECSSKMHGACACVRYHHECRWSIDIHMCGGGWLGGESKSKSKSKKND